jgi:hypothetical protein
MIISESFQITICHRSNFILESFYFSFVCLYLVICLAPFQCFLFVCILLFVLHLFNVFACLYLVICFTLFQCFFFGVGLYFIMIFFNESDIS